MSHKLHGYTLTEMLVVMIVSGIVFLAAMDGLVLFGRYTTRKTAEITRNMQLWEGYGLLQHLAASSDSVAWQDGDAGHLDFAVPDSRIRLFRADSLVAEIFATDDSVLIARRASRTDTLMTGAFDLTAAATADSLRFRARTPDGRAIHVSFPVIPAANRLSIKHLQEQESKYAYE